MSDNQVEREFEKLLGFEKRRKAMLRSNETQSLRKFEPGDYLTLDLLAVRIGDIALDQDQQISGELVDPLMAYVKVGEADGMPELVNKTIGLAVDKRLTPPMCRPVFATLQKSVAGLGEFAYYYPEDVEVDTLSLCVPDGKVVHVPLQYGRLIVGSEIVFDFISRSE